MLDSNYTPCISSYHLLQFCLGLAPIIPQMIPTRHSERSTIHSTISIMKTTETLHPEATIWILGPFRPPSSRASQTPIRGSQIHMFLHLGPTFGQVHTEEICALKFAGLTKSSSSSSLASSLLSSPAFDVGQEDKLSALFSWDRIGATPFRWISRANPCCGLGYSTKAISHSESGAVEWIFEHDCFGAQRRLHIPAFINYGLQIEVPLVSENSFGKYVPTRVPLNFNLFFDARFFYL